MELRFNIDDARVEGLQERTRTPKGSDLGRDAFALLDWATRQAAAGREIGSYDTGGTALIGFEVDAMSRARWTTRQVESDQSEVA